MPSGRLGGDVRTCMHAAVAEDVQDTKADQPTQRGCAAMTVRTTGYLTRDADRLWYECIGEGEPLVLCHGLGGNATVWWQQVPVFGERYRLILWDQRGFGRSTDTNGVAGPVTAADDLVALLDHLEIDRAHLVGQSMGGWAALGLAVASPGRARSLVLSSSTAGVPIPQLAAAGASAVGPPAAGEPSARAVGQHLAITPGLTARDPGRAYLYQSLGSFGDRPSDAVLAGRLRETKYPPQRLARLRCPALFLCGALDPVIPAPLTRAAAEMLGAPVTVWDDAGHSEYFENPDRWNAAVLAFLRQVPAD